MREQLMEDYEARFPILERLSEALELATIRALENVDHIDQVYFRVKEAVSFVQKALDPDNEPPYEHPLAEIEDQVAGRIIVFFREDLDLVQDRLRGTFNSVEFERRRPPADAEFGYETNHVICVVPPQVKTNEWDALNDLPETFELQIRTIFMHAYAEPQHDFGYKSVQELPPDVRRELAWISASAWGADQAYQRVFDWWKVNRQN